jgi:hypothetical protein
VGGEVSLELDMANRPTAWSFEVHETLHCGHLDQAPGNTVYGEAQESHTYFDIGARFQRVAAR